MLGPNVCPVQMYVIPPVDWTQEKNHLGAGHTRISSFSMLPGPKQQCHNTYVPDPEIFIIISLGTVQEGEKKY